WVLPIVSPPIRDGWVAVEDGRVVGLGTAQTLPDRAHELRDRGLTSEVILPGLVNAHTHLELSWMKGRVPPGDSMPAWAQRLIDLRLSESAGGEGPVLEAIAD